METDWDGIRVALRSEMPDNDAAGDEAARRALEIVLGERALRESVDYYVALRPARELVRSVLWLLRPWSEMIRCRELARPPNEMETRRNAVELLRVVADGRALPWVSEFLDDEDPAIQAWGMGLLDQLLWSELVEPDEAENVLRRAERHGSDGVRHRADVIRSYLQGRAREQQAAEDSGSGDRPASREESGSPKPCIAVKGRHGFRFRPVKTNGVHRKHENGGWCEMPVTRGLL